MENYYKNFFEHNISSVFLVEIQEPVSIDLPVKEQVKLIFENAYVKDINISTVELYFGSGNTDKSELINRKLTSIWNKKDYETDHSPVFQFYKKFVESNYVIKHLESKAETPKGQDVWFFVSMRGLIENNHLVGFWGSQLDITELKNLNEKLEKMNYELQDKLEDIAIRSNAAPTHKSQRFRQHNHYYRGYSSKLARVH